MAVDPPDPAEFPAAPPIDAVPPEPVEPPTPAGADPATQLQVESTLDMAQL
jgi:hypothetical protein